MIGTTVSHFEILAEIGVGGMGVVYLARDVRLDRKVALKFLPPHLSADEEARQRFMQEARAASALNHPNVCTIYDIGVTDNDRTFIAMAHYEGETLRSLLAQGPLSEDQAVRIAKQVADGLAAAHEGGIVHRDIKPANIFVTNRGNAVILDFGLAKLTGTLDLTKTGSTLGTAYYMSPEQILGQAVDHRTDIWSLGVVLFEMLSGKRPFAGEYDQAISYAIVQQEAPALSEHPATLFDTVHRALQKDPDERIESASAFAALLENTQRTQTQSIAGIRRPGRGKIAGFVALVTVLLVGAFLWFIRSDNHDTGTAPDDKAVSLVVLPFRNVGPAEYEYMGVGIADDIATRLMAVKALQIKATSSALDLVASGRSLREIGAALDVGFILEGSVQVGVNEVRVSPKLIRVSDQAQVWAEAYNGNPQEALDFQAQVAAAVSENLGITLGLAERATVVAKLTDSDEAYRAYLRGLAVDALQPAERVRLFEEARRLDPKFVLAYLELARTYAQMYRGQYVWAEELDKVRRSAIESAQKVDELAPGSAESSLAKGWISYYVYADYSSALNHFEAARSLRGPESDVLSALGSSHFLLRQYSQGLSLLEQALVLDPRNTNLMLDLAGKLGSMSDFDRAHYWIDRAIEVSPGNERGYAWKAELLGFAGYSERARAVLESAPTFHDPGLFMEAWFHGVYFPQRDFESLVIMADSLTTEISDPFYNCKLLEFKGFAMLTLGYPPAEINVVWLALRKQADEVGGWLRLEALAHAYAGLGHVDSLVNTVAAFKELTDTNSTSLIMSSRAFALAGEAELALDNLEELSKRPFRNILSHPRKLDDAFYDSLRDHPRFKALRENW